MSSYASIVKTGVQPLTQDQLTEMINDPDMQTSWGDLVESEKKTPRTKSVLKLQIKQKEKCNYVSELNKEYPIFPLSPIKSIQEKQVKMLQQKSGITIIKKPYIKEVQLTQKKQSQLQSQSQSQSQKKPIKESLLSSPSDPKPIAFVTEVEQIVEKQLHQNKSVQESTVKIRTHNPTEEELFGNISHIDNKKENPVLISAYDATIKMQQKEITDNAEVIENQKYSMKEYSKGINTNQSNISAQQQIISDNINRISSQKDEIISLSTQVNTLRSSFEYYTNELNKVYTSWQYYSTALKGIQSHFIVESQKNQLLIQQNAELEQQIQQMQEQQEQQEQEQVQQQQQYQQQQLIAYNQQLHQVQQQQQQQQQMQLQVPQYIMQYPPVYYPQQVQPQPHTHTQQQQQQYMTVPMPMPMPLPTPEFMNAFIQAMATVSTE